MGKTTTGNKAKSRVLMTYEDKLKLLRWGEKYCKTLYHHTSLNNSYWVVEIEFEDAELRTTLGYKETGKDLFSVLHSVKANYDKYTKKGS